MSTISVLSLRSDDVTHILVKVAIGGNFQTNIYFTDFYFIKTSIRSSLSHHSIQIPNFYCNIHLYVSIDKPMRKKPHSRWTGPRKVLYQKIANFIGKYLKIFMNGSIPAIKAIKKVSETTAPLLWTESIEDEVIFLVGIISNCFKVKLIGQIFNAWKSTHKIHRSAVSNFCFYNHKKIRCSFHHSIKITFYKLTHKILLSWGRCFSLIK